MSQQLGVTETVVCESRGTMTEETYGAIITGTDILVTFLRLRGQYPTRMSGHFRFSVDSEERL